MFQRDTSRCAGNSTKQDPSPRPAEPLMDGDKMPPALLWAANASFPEQNVHLGHPAKGLFTDTAATAHAVRDHHQTWPLLQSRRGLADESSTRSGKTEASAAPLGQQRRRRAERAGGTFHQPGRKRLGY